MMTQQGVRRLLLAGTAAVASIGSAQAQTTGTAAGTTIRNTATASYSVNGTQRSASSNEATFVVDKKANLTVTSGQSGNTVVNLGQADGVLTFRVSNQTNGTQDILLTAQQGVGIGGGSLRNFDMTDVRIYIDSNNSGGFDANDTQVTYLDEMTPSEVRTVYVVANTPSDDAQRFASVSLSGQVAAGGAANSPGAALTLSTINRPNDVDVVFADEDTDGALGADDLRDGRARAYLEFEVSVNNVNMAVVKSASVLTDGYSALTPAKAIPGARVQYCITATNNSSSTAASNVAISDTIPDNTTYVAGSMRVGLLGGEGVCLLNAIPVNDDGSPVPLSPYSGSYDADNKRVTVSVPTLASTASFAVSFQVTIN